MKTYNECKMKLSNGTVVKMPCHSLTILPDTGVYECKFLNSTVEVPIELGADELYKHMKQIVELGLVTNNIAHTLSKIAYYENSSSKSHVNKDQLDCHYFWLSQYYANLGELTTKYGYDLQVEQLQFASEAQYSFTIAE